MKKQKAVFQQTIVVLLAIFSLTTPIFASSHQDAPLVVLDPAANTTDVYAFVDQDGDKKNLVVALGVYPFEEPGIGPNKFNFDSSVLYEIHVALGKDVAAGLPTISYQFQFTSRTKNRNNTVYYYTGVIQHVDDAAQNFVQSYTVTKVDHRPGRNRTVLGSGVVPPNNQGFVTPFYNRGNNGENPAKEGVATEDKLDRYTKEAIKHLNNGYVSFAGQRDDGFYADIRAIFDLLQLKNAGKDRYSRTSPSEDGTLFRKYAENPELAALINSILLGGSKPGITHNRTDIAAIYIPDLIKVDLSISKARLAGGG